MVDSWPLHQWYSVSPWRARPHAPAARPHRSRRSAVRSESSVQLATGPGTPWVRRLLGAAVVVTYALIVLGGAARLTNTASGCGGDWPLCDGRVIPPLSWATLGTTIEFGHRLA